MGSSCRVTAFVYLLLGHIIHWLWRVHKTRQLVGVVSGVVPLTRWAEMKEASKCSRPVQLHHTGRMIASSKRVKWIHPN